MAQLKERRPEIADFLLRCERDHLAPEDYRAMRNCARSLVGLCREESDSALGALALSMEEALSESQPAARINLISLGRTLLAACHAALLTTQGSAAGPAAFCAPRASGPGAKPTLLSVDDDRIVCEMIRTMFGAHATILTAANGREGLAMIRSHRPDLVLLDDAMPEMTGMTLLETLRQEPDMTSVKVIMLTSSDRPQDLARAAAAGAVDYVIKPFNPDSLAQKVFRELYPAIPSVG